MGPSPPGQRRRPTRDYYFALPKLHLSGAQRSVLDVLQNRDMYEGAGRQPLSLAYFEKATALPKSTIFSAIKALAALGIILIRKVDKTTADYTIQYDPSLWSPTCEPSHVSCEKLDSTCEPSHGSCERIDEPSCEKLDERVRHIRNNRDVSPNGHSTEVPTPPTPPGGAAVGISDRLKFSFLERWPVSINAAILEALVALEAEHGTEQTIRAVEDSRLFTGPINAPTKFLAGKLAKEKARGYTWEAGGGGFGHLRVADFSHIKVQPY